MFSSLKSAPLGYQKQQGKMCGLSIISRKAEMTFKRNMFNICYKMRILEGCLALLMWGSLYNGEILYIALFLVSIPQEVKKSHSYIVSLYLLPMTVWWFILKIYQELTTLSSALGLATCFQHFVLYYVCYPFFNKFLVQRLLTICKY